MWYSCSSALTQRELGGRGRNRAAGSGRVVGSSAALAPGSGFSLGYKAQLLSNYLPNHHQRIETFSHQVFNGIYSTCGDMFVSACQGKLFCVSSDDDFQFHLPHFFSNVLIKSEIGKPSKSFLIGFFSSGRRASEVRPALIECFEASPVL